MHVTRLIGEIDANTAHRVYSARPMSYEESPLGGQNHQSTMTSLPALLRFCHLINRLMWISQTSATLRLEAPAVTFSQYPALVPIWPRLLLLAKGPIAPEDRRI
jgi:hypothetical protein